MNHQSGLPERTLKRIAHYRYYLQKLVDRHRDYVSTQNIASELNISEREVREDLENVHHNLGISDIHNSAFLLKSVEDYLGKNSQNKAIVVGIGNLGKALVHYQGFQYCGFDIIALFDNSPQIIGHTVNNRKVLPISDMEKIIQRLKVDIGIITTPPNVAQGIANKMISSGIKGIWNFSLTKIKVPDDVHIETTSLHNDLIKLIHSVQNPEHIITQE